jgi:hypothetical protein
MASRSDIPAVERVVAYNPAALLLCSHDLTVFSGDFCKNVSKAFTHCMEKRQYDSVIGLYQANAKIMSREAM